MAALDTSGTYSLGSRLVRRLGYGAMQLAGPGVFGPPANRTESLAVLREAVARGVNHIDTSDFYGPHITNQLIREALHPYPKDLVIVTKVGARRTDTGGVVPAMSPAELTSAIHDNLRNLRLDTLEVVNLRAMFEQRRPSEGSIEPALTVLAELQQKGLVQHIGLSNVTHSQLSEGRKICPIVCVQNLYNLAARGDETLVDALALEGIAFVPYFPLGGLTQLQSAVLSAVATRLGATRAQVAIAWLLQRAANILPIPGTSSRKHLRENLAAPKLALPFSALNELENMS
jgi:aryl-alcohol dehydrogenase-like predicted oxidoreductase